MPKFPITLLCLVSVLIVACATDDKARDSGSQGSILERIPIVYRQDIQQGNVFDQSMVSQLHAGLSKRQVRFIMGSPMLVDPFRNARWDYIYTMTHGWGDTKYKRVQVYFDKQDRLERVEGDLKLTPGSDIPVKQETVVSIPDYQDPNRGIIKQAAEQITNTFESVPSASPPPMSKAQLPTKP